MKRYKKNQLEQLSKILKSNGVISVPTDTVYGLCATIKSKQAHQNLMRAKNRPKNKLFPIMCANIEQIQNIAILNENAEKIIKTIMPGPITLILNKNPKLPQYINNGKSTIAVRMATSDVLKELILKNESPVFMTSANQSGEEVCKTLDEIERKCPLIDAILEGDVSFMQASTIVDCTSKEIKILREGPITKNQIEKIINKKI